MISGRPLRFTEARELHRGDEPRSAIARLPVVTTSHVRPVAYHHPEGELPVPEPPGGWPAVPAEPVQDLTLEHLEQLALRRNPSIAEAAAQVRAMRGKWLQAGLPPNPTIGYLAGEIGDAGKAGQQGGFFGQRLITGGKLRLSRAVVGREIARAEQLLFAQQQRVLTDVRLAFYDALIAQRRIDLTGELVDISNQAVKASRQLLQGKEIPRVALLQTEVEAHTVEILQRRALNAHVATWRRLTSVLAYPELPRQRLAGDVEAWLEEEFDWEEQLQALLVQSPETAQAVADLERSRWMLDRAYAEVLPDINVRASAQRDNASGDTIAGVQLGMPLPLWNKNQGGIRQAREQIRAAQRNIDRIELDLRDRLAVAFRQYADARFQARNYANRILPKARETLDLVTSGYERAQVDYLELLTAQRTYFQTSLSYIEALRELWNARLRIQGMLLQDSLSNSPTAMVRQ